MKTFRKPKPEKQTTKPKRKRHLKGKLALSIIFCLIFIAFGYLLTYLIVEYKETHTWTFQTPIVIEREYIIKDSTATTSALPIAYAQEYQNPFDPESPKGMAWEAVKNEWGIGQWSYFETLITRESNFNPYAVNSSSGAHGIFQSLGHASYTCEGWQVDCQIEWGINYILERYQTPKDALDFWNDNGWY